MGEPPRDPWARTRSSDGSRWQRCLDMLLRRASAFWGALRRRWAVFGRFADRVPLRENWYRDVWLFVISLLLLVSFLVAYTSNRHRIAENHALAVRTASALCALERDLESRVAQGHAFLASHPHGAFGLSATAIRASVEGQQRTINALRILRCNRGGGP